ncbi:thiamine pyrophosphate-dependent acetolactate synthase large subunit-like protein [Cupriavidus metallidurans]|jgi:thiamine pyrophosphate-dependent acetolactate synthase large subunit-like protein|nr:hypothetical protein AU374_01717 [Cupriavidus metallidurans]
MGKKVAEIIVEVLEQAGVKRCYGIVGDTLNLIAEHLDRSSSTGSVFVTKKRAPLRQALRRYTPTT